MQLASESDTHVEIDAQGELIGFEVDFTEPHLRQDLLAAVAAARAVGVQPGGRLELALSPGRGQRRLLPGEVTLIDDAYNANPVSMRAALDALAATGDRAAGASRCSATCSSWAPTPSATTARSARTRTTPSIVLVTVGPLAAAMAPGFHGEHHHAADADGGRQARADAAAAAVTSCW